MKIAQEKRTQRNLFKAIREKEVKQKNNLIYSKVVLTIRELIREKNSLCFIGIYWPIHGEVDLRPLRQLNEFSLALPSSNFSKEINSYRVRN